MRSALGTTQAVWTKWVTPALGAVGIAGVLAGGCDSKSPTDPSGPKPGACGVNSTPDTMSAKIDGLDWSSVFVIGQRVQDLVSITGNDGCNPSRVLTFNVNVKGPGTYKVPETEKEDEVDVALLTALLSIEPGGWDAQFPFGKGSVTFATLNASSASGTFFFTLQPMKGTNSAGSHSVTNGAFNVKFTVLSEVARDIVRA